MFQYLDWIVVESINCIHPTTSMDISLTTIRHHHLGLAMVTCLSKDDWFAIDRLYVIKHHVIKLTRRIRWSGYRSWRRFHRSFNRCDEPEVRRINDQLTSFVTDLETAAPAAALVVVLVGWGRRQRQNSRVTARRSTSKVTDDDRGEWRRRWRPRPSINVRVDHDGRPRDSPSDERG